MDLHAIECLDSVCWCSLPVVMEEEKRRGEARLCLSLQDGLLPFGDCPMDVSLSNQERG